MPSTIAWLEQDYHRRKHRELAMTPNQRLAGSIDASRPCPGSAELKAAFRITIKRTLRRSDGTVSVEGTRYQVPQPWRHLRGAPLRVHLQIASLCRSTVRMRVSAHHGRAHVVPVEAVRICIRKGVTFTGRASQSEYWWWLFLVGLIDLAYGGTMYLAHPPFLTTATLGRALLWVVVLVPTMAVTVRRLHDTGWSGRWAALHIPMVVFSLHALATGPELSAAASVPGTSGRWRSSRSSRRFWCRSHVLFRHFGQEPVRACPSRGPGPRRRHRRRLAARPSSLRG